MYAVPRPSGPQRSLRRHNPLTWALAAAMFAAVWAGCAVDDEPTELDDGCPYLDAVEDDWGGPPNVTSQDAPACGDCHSGGGEGEERSRGGAFY